MVSQHVKASIDWSLTVKSLILSALNTITKIAMNSKMEQEEKEKITLERLLKWQYMYSIIYIVNPFAFYNIGKDCWPTMNFFKKF
jgi:hypothetical protein